MDVPISKCSWLVGPAMLDIAIVEAVSINSLNRFKQVYQLAAISICMCRLATCRHSGARFVGPAAGDKHPEHDQGVVGVVWKSYESEELN